MENPQKMDFAYGIGVQLQEHQLYEFVVSPQMYRYLQQDKLSDLRVFDEAGNMAPLEILVVKKTEPVAQAEPVVRPLVFFTLEEAKNIAAKSTVSVQSSSNQQQYSATVNIEATGAGDKQQTREYVVDLGQGVDAVRELELLRLDWNTQQVHKASVTVLTSADLTQWQEAGAASLYHLQVKEHRLVRGEFPLRGILRYLLIRAQDNPDFELKSVHAVKKPATQRRDNIVTASAELLSRKENSFDYQIPAKVQLHAIRVYPGDRDAVYSVLLMSGQGAKKVERVHFQGSVYNLTVAGDVVQSPYQNVRSNDVYWNLQVLENNRSGISNAPLLEYQYYPRRVRFLSNRAGSYTIAFGSGKVLTAAPALPESVKVSGLDITRLELPPAQSMGGMASLETPVPASYSRKLVLWAVLFVVLGVMVYMVLRLVRHMHQEQNDQ